MRRIWEKFLVVLFFVCVAVVLAVFFYAKWKLTWGRIG